MQLDATQRRMLDLLADACTDCGEAAVGKQISALANRAMPEVLHALSSLERTGMDPTASDLITKYARWIDGALSREDFVIACRVAQGLM